MTKREIKTLTIASYKNDKLNEAFIVRVMKALSRKDMKAYLRALQLEEKKRKIYVATAQKSGYNTTKKSLEKIFAHKDIVFQEDPSLLLGLKIIDNDIVYDMSLKNQLETVAKEVTQ